jgi:PKD domain/Secretion system C-terminal sorting domain
MLRLRLSVLTLLFCSLFSMLFAQIGCPGCVTQINPAFPADTLYLQAIPDGTYGVPYDQDISFRMPKTTTPVHAVDSTTPPNLPISKIEILGVDGVPPGLFWQPNQFVFETGTQTDGIKLCGTPTQSDSFVLTVRLKATVFVIAQETSFPLKMYIGPKVSITEGFTMENFTGCAPLTTSFSNNIPSNGNAGYSYKWDFGDGTFSSSETPGTHTYPNPGLYTVNYQAIVDTNGYKLESITILDVDCVDQLGLGDPDLYARVSDANGNLLFDSSPNVPDANLPLTLPIGLLLNEQNYTLLVMDEDSGLKGGDDECGTFTFNLLSNDTIVAGGLTVVLNISHLVDTILSADTVTAFAVPAVPVFSNINNELCLLDTSLFPTDSFYFQWSLGGIELPDGREQCFCATESGIYTLQVFNLEGCVSEYSLPVLHNPAFDCTISTFSPNALTLHLFPNPSEGIVWVRMEDMSSEEVSAKAWDSTGRLVLEGTIRANGNAFRVDLSGQMPGLYFLSVQQGGKWYVGKVLLEKQ